MMVRSTDQQSKPKPKYKPGKNPKSLANLRADVRWKPGQSGNPKGCPPARTNLRTYVRQFMSMTPQEFKAVDQNTLTISQWGAYGHVLKFYKDAVAKLGAEADANIAWKRVKEEFDRDEGQPDQNVNLSMIEPEIAAMDDDQMRAFIRDSREVGGGRN